MIIIIIYILINTRDFIVMKQYSKQNKDPKIKKEPHIGTTVPQISQEEPQLRFFLFSPFFIRHKE